MSEIKKLKYELQDIEVERTGGVAWSVLVIPCTIKKQASRNGKALEFGKL